MPGFQMLELPYAGDDLSLVALLPNERDGLAELEASLTSELWDTGTAALRGTLVDVALPKFTFDSSFKLADPLKAMGMTDAFDEDLANLTGIAEPLDENLKIDNVIHKAFIDVNEEGTEAAAATAVIIVMDTSALQPPEPKVFRADHPFLFAIRDRHSGSLLFLGRVTEPGELAASTALVAVPEPAAWMLFVGATIAIPIRRRRSPELLN